MMQDYQELSIAPDFRVSVTPIANKSLSTVIESEIESIWQKEKHQNPHLFNGRLLSLISYSAHELIGTFVEYKHHLAQLRHPEIASVLGITPVCVSGITCMGTRLLMGKRSSTVLQYPSFYELVPSGGVDADSMKGEREVDIVALTLRELQEESGIDKSQVVSVKPISLIIDNRDRNVEICIDIQLKETGNLNLTPISHEHTQLDWMNQEHVYNLDSRETQNWVPLSLYLVKRYFSR